MKRTDWILTIIVFAQFTGTSLWFAGNAVVKFLPLFNESSGIGVITSSVQFGFIVGTFLYALFTISDRFSPSKVFFMSTFIASLANLLVIFFGDQLYPLIGLRFVTGFFLAGIYPVGMKIAADWHESGLGKALGFLVGALVVGTAFPHIVTGMGINETNWKWVLISTSILSLSGAIMLLITVPDGPYRKSGSRINLYIIPHLFRIRSFRKAAAGYFGHMWELYTFWAFVPVILRHFLSSGSFHINESLLVFLIIASGGIGCVVGGYLSLTYGSRKVAISSLIISGACSAAAPLFFGSPSWIFIPFLFIWGITVVADSPQFSTLVAQSVQKEKLGTALTFTNSIGFFVTIISIQWIESLLMSYPIDRVIWLLAIGPVVGVISVMEKTK